MENTITTDAGIEYIEEVPDSELDDRFITDLVDALELEIASGILDRELARDYCW